MSKSVDEKSERKQSTSAALDKYVAAFESGSNISYNVTGLCGRILRGKKPNDFLSLSDDSNRDLVMLLGPDGLQALPGSPGYDMLLGIGYTRDFIRTKVLEGTMFKLVVFPESMTARLATWDNVSAVVSHVYPSVASKIQAQIPSLKELSITEIEEVAGYVFSDVFNNGITDPRYMTKERLEAAEGTLVDVRAFLYCTVQLRDLFSGDGYTYTPDGERSLMEYITKNALLSQLQPHALLNVDVELPPEGDRV